MYYASKQTAPVAEQPVLRATGPDHVYAALRDEILLGRLPPETRLTEVELGRRFGLSSTPIREALQRLVYRGLAVRHVARGVSVRSLSARDVRDIYELRCLLEPCALHASIGSLTKHQVAAIGRSLAQAGAALRSGDMLRLSALNDRFHIAILEGAPNQLLIQWIETLGDLRRLIAIREWTTRDGAEREHREHLAIHARIVDREPEEASRLLLEHIKASAITPAELATGPRLRR